MNEIWSLMIQIGVVCALLFVLLFLGVLLMKFEDNYQLHEALKGQYAWGKVTIWPDEQVNMRDYLGTAVHEYAHYWLDKKSNKDVLKAWSSAVTACGLESGYNFATVKGKSARVKEEFAECTKEVYLGSTTCCSAKVKLIQEWAVMG